MVRLAGRFAAANDATLVLYAEATEEDVTEATVVSGRGGELPQGASQSAVDSARRFLEGVADEELADVDVEYETACSIVPTANHAESVLRTASEEGCDHLFVVGEKRSPAGKALFGDFVQSLLLNFDGRVTVDLAE